MRRFLNLEVDLDPVSAGFDLHRDELCLGLAVLLIMIVGRVDVGHGGVLDGVEDGEE